MPSLSLLFPQIASRYPFNTLFARFESNNIFIETTFYFMSRITKSKSLTNRPSVLQSIRAVDEHLKDLHRLKTQVEELDIIRVPHKQPPVTRQIRELMDVSSQILRKRSRNQLGASTKAVSNLISTLGGEDNKEEHGLLQTQRLKKKMDELFGEKHDIGVINNHGPGKVGVKELGDFLTHNECAQFDPLEAAFKRLDPQNQGEIDYKTITQLMEVLEIDTLSKETLAKLLGVERLESITLGMFRKIVGKFDTI